MIVYLVTNKLNGKQYVGQTVRPLAQRWRRHGWVSTQRCAHPLALAIQKYGKSSFLVEELEECGSQGQLDERETYWAKALNTFSPNGYNLRTGKGRGVAAPEVGQRISAANKGRKFSEKHRRRLRDAHLGVHLSSERVYGMRKRMRGIAPSEATRLGASEKNSKVYHLCNPQGVKVKIRNLRSFCRGRGLSYPKMCEMANNKRASYKGWTIPGVREEARHGQGTQAA